MFCSCFFFFAPGFGDVTMGVGEQSLRGGKTNAAVTDPVCLLTVGNTSSITQPTQSGPEPVWDQSFDFPASFASFFFFFFFSAVSFACKKMRSGVWLRFASKSNVCGLLRLILACFLFAPARQVHTSFVCNLFAFFFGGDAQVCKCVCVFCRTIRLKIFFFFRTKGFACKRCAAQQ